jgi:SHS family lactate transporter-like MFS transporter
MDKTRESLEKVEHPAHVDNDDSPHHAGHSIRAQLETWHADRGDKSIAKAMIPRPKTSKDASKNPIKFLGEISGINWLLFLSGWFCWTCDG